MWLDRGLPCNEGDIDSSLADLDLWVGGGPGTVSGHLFKNLTVEQKGPAARWLALRTVGDGKKVNRDGFGTRITVRQGEKTVAMREQKSSRGTYNSTDTRVLHFGLGDLTGAYTVDVQWPDGSRQSFGPDALPLNHYASFYNDGAPVGEGRGRGSEVATGDTAQGAGRHPRRVAGLASARLPAATPALTSVRTCATTPKPTFMPTPAERPLRGRR